VVAETKWCNLLRLSRSGLLDTQIVLETHFSHTDFPREGLSILYPETRLLSPVSPDTSQLRRNMMVVSACIEVPEFECDWKEIL
jgi:hypothetical protein